MSSNDDQYGRYRRDEQEQHQRLLEQEAEIEDQRAWEAYLAGQTKIGELRVTERIIEMAKEHWIAVARKKGKTLKEAKIDGEFELVKMRKRLVALD